MDVKNLPESMENKELHIRKYRIDYSTSNNHVNLEKANLQLVEEEQILPTKNYHTNPFLETNTLQLILIEPIIRTLSRKAYKF